MDIRQLFPALSDDEFSQELATILVEVLNEIRSNLRGFNDLSPIPIPYHNEISVGEDMMRLGCIRMLADNKIIHWDPEDETNEHADYLVTVVNRYQFEQLYLNSTGRTEEQTNEELPNLVFYNPLSGIGLVNGNPIHLKPKSKRKAKELFDALFAAAPEPVPREKLIAILRLGSDAKFNAKNYVAEELSYAFTNLRKRCGVKADVIEIDRDGRLNAHVALLNKLPEFYIFPEIDPEII